MRKISILVLLGFTFLLTGCGNAVEINERSFITIVGIDKSSDNTFTLTTANAILSSDDNKGSLEKSTKTGSNIATLLSENPSKTSKKQYLGQAKTIILGEALLLDNTMLKKTLDSLSKINELNAKAIILGGKASAKDCIETLVKADNEYGLYIWDFYKNRGFENGLTYKLTLNDVLKHTYKNTDFIIPFIEALDDELSIEKGGIIKDNSLVYSLSNTEMESAMLILEKSKGSILTIDETVVRLNSINTNINFKTMDNGACCCINIALRVEPLSKALDLDLISNTLVKNIGNTVSKLYLNKKADPLAIKTRLYKFKPSLYKHYDNMEFNVNISLEKV